LRSRHSLPLADRAGHQIDLHWRAYGSSFGDRDDDRLWDSSSRVQLDGVETRTLTHADHFLQAIAHGIDVTRNIHWVADAMTILAHAGASFDWDRVIAEASRRRLVMWLRLGVEFLIDALDCQVPADVIRRIRALPSTRSERAEFWMMNRRGPLAPWNTLAYLWYRYGRYEHARTGSVRLRGFLAFVGDVRTYRAAERQTARTWPRPPAADMRNS
jgi:hypothetical protein